MRRTKAALIYKRTKNLRAVQLLLGHSKLESTVRYLDIEVNDTPEISEQTEIQPAPCGRMGSPVRPLSGLMSNSRHQPGAEVSPLQTARLQRALLL